jgi:hypothetical protein
VADGQVDAWFDVGPGDIPRGQWARLARPQMHCEGWGAGGRGRATTTCCNGGTGLWSTSRARWVRWDCVLQCGTCHRLDQKCVAQEVSRDR